MLFSCVSVDGATVADGCASLVVVMLVRARLFGRSVDRVDLESSAAKEDRRWLREPPKRAARVAKARVLPATAAAQCLGLCKRRSC